MGKRGPKQEPKHLKLLKGNKYGVNEDAPQPDPIANPCPDYLGDVARETWYEYAPKLEELGMLTELDGLQFRNLCIVEEIIQRTYARLAERENYINVAQSGYELQVPEIGILNGALMHMNRLSDRFGLDPISRQSLKTPNNEQTATKLKRLLSK